MAGEFIMPLLYDIETWKSFVPNIMSGDYCISKEKSTPKTHVFDIYRRRKNT